ncbi:hypothetical protein YC2023_029515 [Brassica napus]
MKIAGFIRELTRVPMGPFTDHNYMAGTTKHLSTNPSEALTATQTSKPTAWSSFFYQMESGNTLKTTKLIEFFIVSRYLARILGSKAIYIFG